MPQIIRCNRLIPLVASLSFCLSQTAFGQGPVCWNDGECQRIPPISPVQVAPAQSEQTRVKPAPAKERTGKPSTVVKVRTAVPTSAKLMSQASPHKVAIQVNQNDKAVMDLALNNVRNIAEYYKQKGETVAIEVVTYGPGLHMLRSDTSPVKDRIAPMALENPNVTFIACGNTQANQSKAEGKPVTLVSEAKVVPSGVVRLMELQKQG